MKTQLLISSLLFAAAASAAIQPAPALCLTTPKNLTGKAASFITPALQPVDRLPEAAEIPPVTTTILTTISEGELMQDVVWYSKACYPGNGKVEWAEVTGFVPAVVTDGNTMYIYNAITQLSEYASAWIRGTISDDGKTVTFPTPQAYMINEATPGVKTMLYATRLSGTTGKPEAQTSLIFEINENGDIIQTDGGVLALTDEQDNFYGFGDMDIKITKIHDEMVQIPDNADISTYEMIYESGNSTNHLSAKIGISGMDIYFSDPLGQEDIWFKGTLTADDQVIVHTPQYLGTNSGYPLYVVTGKEIVTTETDPVMGIPVQVVTYDIKPEADIIFEYDASTGTYTCRQLLILSSEKDKQGLAAVAVKNPVYKPWTAYAATPASPSVSFYLDPKEYESYGLSGCMATFEIPAESVDGDFIPQEDLFYTIYFDEEPLVFYDGTLLPYYGQFQDAATQTALSVSGISHQLQTPLKPTYKIGVQSFYYYNQTLIQSELVEYDIINGEWMGAVDTINTDSNTVTRSEYFDLTGRRVAADAEGIVIRRDVMADGAARSTKILNVKK